MCLVTLKPARCTGCSRQLNQCTKAPCRRTIDCRDVRTHVLAEQPTICEQCVITDSCSCEWAYLTALPIRTQPRPLGHDEPGQCPPSYHSAMGDKPPTYPNGSAMSEGDKIAGQKYQTSGFWETLGRWMSSASIEAHSHSYEESWMD
jgi:hypothetical protein